MAKQRRPRGTVGGRRVERRPASGAGEMPAPWVSAVRLVHPFPSLVVTAVTVAMAFLADSSPPAWVVAQLGLGMLCYQFAIGVANDVVDASDDALSKPWKAIPRGVVSLRLAMASAALLAGAGMVVTSGLPFGAWLIGISGLGCGLVYDAQLKRTPLSWLPMAVALPLVPAWVFVALDRWNGLLWWAFPLGAILGLALHLANQAPDVGAEPRVGGTAHRVGSERAARLALGLVGLAGLGAVALLLFEGANVQAVAIAVAVLSAGLLSRRAVGLFGRDGLFGLLASTAAVLAVAFVSAAG